MPLALPRASRCHFLGDSRTVDGWFSSNGGLLDQLHAAWIAIDVARAGTPSGTPLRFDTISAGTAPGAQNVVVTQSGVSGNKVADILADVPNRFTVFNPDVCFLWVGINDVINATALGTFTTQYGSLLDAMHAAKPNCQIVVMSDPFYGEQWVATNPLTWFLTGATGPTFGFNATTAALAVARPSYCTYVELSGPALIYESTHNPPAGAGGADGGIISRTGDIHGLHPNATVGQQFLSSVVFGALSLA
jgi:hypothetical protein